MLIPRFSCFKAWPALALLGAVLGCATPPHNSSSGDFPTEPYATLTSEQGALVLEVRTAPSQPPTRGSAAVELRITDPSGGPIDALDLRVVPFMPDMGHAASDEPEIEELGEGRYEVAPVDMFMSGRWELITTILDPIHDGAVVTFDIE